MNSETQTTSVPSHCEAQLVAANPQPSTGSSRRRTGKIATLPKSSRTRLNQMLEDGLPYAIIIKSLGRDGKRLTENNLSDWHKGGYQDWLKEREWLDDMRARHELALNLIRENGDCKIHQATLLIAATVISDLLKNLDPTSLSRS